MQIKIRVFKIYSLKNRDLSFEKTKQMIKKENPRGLLFIEDYLGKTVYYLDTDRTTFCLADEKPFSQVLKV